MPRNNRNDSFWGTVPAAVAGIAAFAGATLYTAAATGVTWGAVVAAFTADIEALTALDLSASAWPTLVGVPVAVGAGVGLVVGGAAYAAAQVYDTVYPPRRAGNSSCALL